MRKYLFWGLSAAVVVIAAVLAIYFGGSFSGDKYEIASSDPMVTQLQEMGEIVVMRAYVADVLSSKGYEYEGAWLIKGDALIAVDLEQATKVSADEEAKKLVIRLPQPEVIQPRVDHEKTQTWDVKKTNWIPWGGDQDKLRDEAMRDAQRLVEETCGSEEIMDQAREQALVQLTNMYAFVGWTVEIVWEG